jgi:adenylate cyclase
MGTELFANEGPQWYGASGAPVAPAPVATDLPAGDGQSRLAACVMTDAERYTSLTEGMEPRKVVTLVNSYFTALFGPVLEHGGRVVDVKGDGILAIWIADAPDAEVRGRVCEGCLAIAQAVDRFNAANPAARLPTRIGVDYGPIALANVGALARYEYRAVGETVNTSSRLEQLNKDLGTRLLVSAPLAEGVKGFLFRDLGGFTLRGKQSPLRVLELVAQRATAQRPQIDLCEAFASALAKFERGNVEGARREFAALRARYPSDGPARYYARRCETLARHRGFPAAVSLDYPYLPARGNPGSLCGAEQP